MHLGSHENLQGQIMHKRLEGLMNNIRSIDISAKLGWQASFNHVEVDTSAHTSGHSNQVGAEAFDRLAPTLGVWGVCAQTVVTGFEINVSCH